MNNKILPDTLKLINERLIKAGFQAYPDPDNRGCLTDELVDTVGGQDTLNKIAVLSIACDVLTDLILHGPLDQSCKPISSNSNARIVKAHLLSKSLHPV